MILMIIAELSGRRRQSPNRELKQQTFSAQRRQPEVTLTSDSRFPPLWLAVATRRQRHIACFAIVSKTWDFFSPLCLKDKFFLLLIHCFKIVPVCFSQDGRQTTQTNVSFLSYFVFVQSLAVRTTDKFCSYFLLWKEPNCFTNNLSSEFLI